MENVQNTTGSLSPIERYDLGHVQEVIRQAHDELRQLIRQRAEIMKRIGTVKQTIAGLANLFGDNVLSEELLELVGRQPGVRALPPGREFILRYLDLRVRSIRGTAVSTLSGSLFHRFAGYSVAP